MIKRGDLMEELSNNKRCKVETDGNVIYKTYKSELSFQNEKTMLERLAKYPFVPKIIEISDMKITMEKINAPTIWNYTFKNKYIPHYYSIAMKTIEEILIEEGDYCHPDISKDDHIFIDSKANSPITYGVRLIDFDADEVSIDLNNHAQRKKDALKELNKKYAYLNDDAESWEKFKYSLQTRAYSPTWIEDYKRNMICHY